MPAKVIKLTEAEIKLIKPTVEDHQVAQAAFRHAAWLIKKHHTSLWEQLGKLYPDVVGKDAKFDHDTFEIAYLD